VIKASAVRSPHPAMRALANVMPIPFPAALVVRSASDLEAVRKLRSARRVHVLLRVSGLPIEKAKQWESKLNAALKDCGCASGAACMAGGFIASLIWQSTFSIWAYAHLPGFLLRTFLVVISAAGAGKALGLLRARALIRGIEKQIRDFEVRYTTGD
jgi:hypothetical protein